MTKVPAIRDLRKAAEHWRDALGLGDWTLYVVYGKPVTGRDPDPYKCEIAADCEGHAFWYTENSYVLLVLRRGQATVQTVVHELLHVRLEGHLPAPRKYDLLYERALNVLADTLLKSKEQ